MPFIRCGRVAGGSFPHNSVYTPVFAHASFVGMRGLLALLVLAFAATTAAAGDLLFDAVAAGDKTAVEQALADGADVDARARDQATPLIVAALSDHLAIAELLLSKSADVMARNSGGFTALHAAAFSGSLPIAQLLL